MTSFFRNCVRTTALFLATVSMASCGTESKEPAGQLGFRPYYDFQYNLDPLTIAIRLFHPDYGIPSSIDVYEGSTLCDSQRLSTQTGMLTLNNNSSCRDFTINLQYVSAANACQPGGLYLMSATVTNPDNGQATSYQNMTLAGWDQNYKKVTPWLTPFDQPNLVSQASKSDFVQGSLTTAGQWTYQLNYASSVTPPVGCSLQTNLDLKLTPADAALGSRLLNYTVSETNVGGQITASVTTDAAGAPAASVELDGANRHLTFAGLDVLREANAQTSLIFRQPTQAHPVTFTPLQPLVNIGSELWLNSSNQFPAGSLASHFGQLFSTITAPLMGFYGPLSLEPHLIMKVAVSLATPLSSQYPPLYTVTPITLVPDYPYRPGFDDKADCTIVPDPGLSCKLDSVIAAYTATHSLPAAAAHYTLDITFYSQMGGQNSAVINLQNVVIPVSNIKRL